MSRLGRDFYSARSTSVARSAIGKTLVRVADGIRLTGAIVEAEAYRGSGDPASHAFGGKTRRNEVMFGEPGHAYVYFTYGSSFCLNLTCETEGIPAAVLVRAVEPLEGVEVMKRNRHVEDLYNVASGPGKLTQALGIGRELNGEDLVTSSRLFLEDGPVPKGVQASTRVGVSRGADLRWRYFVAGSRYVSRGKPSSPQAQNP